MDKVVIAGQTYAPVLGNREYWECEVEFMHGDADLYTTEVFRWDTIEEVERFFDVCDRLPPRKYIDGALQLKEWIATIPGFMECFTSFTSMEDFEQGYGEDYYPSDKTCHGWYLANMQGIELFRVINGMRVEYKPVK